MTKICVAKEIILKIEENTYNFYVKEELVLVVGNSEYGYLYLDDNTDNICNIIDINHLNTYKISLETEIKECNVEKIIGISNITPINEFTGINDVAISLKIIDEYNNKRKDKYTKISIDNNKVKTLKYNQ